MSKSRIAIAVIVAATALSTGAPARGRSHLSLGPLGAFTRLLSPGLLFHGGHARRVRMHARQVRPPSDRSQDSRYAVNPASREEALDHAKLLTDPAARGQIAASAALALWHGEPSGAGGWWSHGHGGYGWVGPLFWPFAYDDIYGYTIFADGVGFWDYGYRDIYAGIFGPYGHDDLSAYLAPDPSARRDRKVPSMRQLCGDAGEIAGLPIDRIRQAIQPTEAQRTALDDLAKASTAAAGMIQASCPRQTASTGPARLAVMRERVEAMINAVMSLEWPLEKLYDQLDDTQKTRLNALADNQRKTAAANAGTDLTVPATPAPACEGSQSGALQWPMDEIEDRLHPNDAQRSALEALKRASAWAADILNYECRSHDAVASPGRLLAVDQRLHDMLQAINRVSAALEDFYATLSDEQKAQFEAIGPRRTA